MRSFPLLIAMILLCLEAQAGTLYTYRTPAGAPVFSNYEMAAEQIQARGLVLGEVRYRPDTPNPDLFKESFFQMLRSSPGYGLAPGEKVRSSRSVYTPASNLNRPMYINPLVIRPMTTRPADLPPKLVIQPMTPTRVVVSPVVIPPVVVAPVVTPKVTPRPVTINPVVIEPANINAEKAPATVPR